jgi:hypothetical protein
VPLLAIGVKPQIKKETNRVNTKTGKVIYTETSEDVEIELMNPTK